MNDDTTASAPTPGSYPVWNSPDDQARAMAPATHTDDPIAAAHWDESQWRNGALPNGRVITSVPQG